MNPFEPALLGALTARNRFVLAPMTTYSSYPDGVIREDELPYLALRARSFGIVMTAACRVHKSGHAFDGQWSCEDDRFLDSMRSVAEAIHSGGALAVIQIHHGGRQCPSRLCGTPWSASAVPAERPNAETPHAMTQAEIDLVVNAFGAASRRAQLAGFDAIEIHGANTYLLQQFVSPHSNRRKDVYGEDRLRLSREVIRSCQANTNLPIGYRLSPEEPETPGIRLSDTWPLLDLLCEEGMAWIDVSLRRYDQPSLHDASSRPVLEQIADYVNGRSPIMGGGAINSRADAERCGTDYIYVGRAAITQPDFVDVTLTGDTPRTLVPAENAAEALTIPAGLAKKIYEVPGWFPVEGVTVP